MTSLPIHPAHSQQDAKPGQLAPPSPPSRSRDPEEILGYALERFGGWNLIMTTGFGMEGCVLMDMASKLDASLRVLYIDTDFLFKETYELRDRLAERYPKLTLERIGTDLSPAQQAEQVAPELWKSDPDRCCHIRKVEPLRKALAGVDVWITAIRREQSESRANTRPIQWDDGYGLLKVSPLAYWDRASVWAYIKQHDVPYNPLHEQGYPSIGCTHCTNRVEGIGPDGYSREGRWTGQDKSECGLHLGENI